MKETYYKILGWGLFFFIGLPFACYTMYDDDQRSKTFAKCSTHKMRNGWSMDKAKMYCYSKIELRRTSGKLKQTHICIMKRIEEGKNPKESEFYCYAQGGSIPARLQN